MSFVLDLLSLWSDLLLNSLVVLTPRFTIIANIMAEEIWAMIDVKWGSYESVNR
jgi:hypothetical protein